MGLNNNVRMDLAAQDKVGAVGLSDRFAHGEKSGVGPAVPVRDHQMQPFGPVTVASVARLARTTAVAITDVFGGLGEGQVPR